MYPPGYQLALLPWMEFFGTSVISAMVFHLMLFAVVAWLTVAIVRKYFSGERELCAGGAVALCGSPLATGRMDLAHNFGLGSLWHGIADDEREWQRTASVADAGGDHGDSCYCAAFYVGDRGSALYFMAQRFIWRARWRCNGRGDVIDFLFDAVCHRRRDGVCGRHDFASRYKEPLWWGGFMESARQQSVVSGGFHAPILPDLLKLARSAPVFILALMLAPVMWARWKEIWSIAPGKRCLALFAGSDFVGDGMGIAGRWI